jgi:hypothetical protein
MPHTHHKQGEAGSNNEQDYDGKKFDGHLRGKKGLGAHLGYWKEDLSVLSSFYHKRF